MQIRPFVTWAVALAALSTAPRAVALAEGHAFFEQRIRPILVDHCYKCHSAESGKSRGGLRLDSREGLARGGASETPAIVPGDPEQSLLIAAVRHTHPELQMPPKQKLSDRQIADLVEWVRMGAPDPRIAESANHAVKKADPVSHWAFLPPRLPPMPAVKNQTWARTDIDRFILASLEAKALSPAPPADKRTLLRRATFDLIGLPPTPEEVEAFLSDTSPHAFERIIDRLLASPHYGERWARHWLDVIRFGESQGFERNFIRENAWRYRDWVINAFNRDLPYDQFISHQIAGDVLHPDDADALIATGFHVIGTWDQVGITLGSKSMQKVASQDYLEDLVATVGQAFLGLTINCARCHDHKYDPISQKEYYQFAALLGGIGQDVKEPKIKRFSKTLHVPVLKQPPVFHVLERGNVNNPGEVVSPAGLRALQGLSPDFGLSPDAPEAERRVKLAEWLTDPRNPLTARVFVNRVWQHHFGQALVATPSEFGLNADPPSHTELLDYLAIRFMERGWKLKDLHRLIMTSAVYQQQSQVLNQAAQSTDRDNRLLWRFNRRRLEGEAIRDAALAVAGALNRKLGGASFRDVKVELSGNHLFTDPTNEFSENTRRRTIYRLWARSGNHPLLDALDCPDPSVMTPKRMTTITPLQALSLMNNPFMEACAAEFAKHARTEAGKNADPQVTRLYHLAFARKPTKQERALAARFIKAHGLEQFCLVLFSTSEFLYVD